MSTGAHTPGRASRPRHVPMRRCLACRASRPQAELVRLVQGEGQWLLDPGRKAPGRGAWLCRDNSACHSPKALKRSLKGQAERIADELRVYFEGQASGQATPAEARLEAPASAQPEAKAQASKPGRVRVRAAGNRTGKNGTGKNGTSKNGNSRNGGPNV